MDRALSGRRYDGPPRGGGGGDYWRGDSRFRGGRYSRGRYGRGRGGGWKRRRTDNYDNHYQARQPRPAPVQQAPPPQQTGAAATRLVQLFVRVADVWARSTTDADSSLISNLGALAGAVKAKDLIESPQRVANLLCLVARSSPAGAIPLGVLANAMNSNEAMTTASLEAAALAVKEARPLDFKLSIKFRSALSAGNQVLQALIHALNTQGNDTLAITLASCATISTDEDIRHKAAEALSTYLSYRNETPPKDLLELAAQALGTETQSIRLAPRQRTLDEFDSVQEESTTIPIHPEEAWSRILGSSIQQWAWRPRVPIIKGLLFSAEQESNSKLSRLERFYILDTAVDIMSAFRVGVKWNGIVVGTKASAARQLLALDRIFELDQDEIQQECRELAVAALIACACAGRAPEDGALNAESNVAGGADYCLELVHLALELCRAAPESAKLFANGIELVFRSLDDIDALFAYRLCLFTAYFLNNTKFNWPYWSYWSEATVDAPNYDRQRKFVVDLLDHLVRLSYLDRLKCTEGFPEDLHSLLPPEPKPKLNIQQDERPQLADIALGLDSLLGEDDDDKDAMQEDERPPPPPPQAVLLALETCGDDDAAKCAWALRTALEISSATVSHAMSALDTLASPLGELVRGDEPCEDACLDALVSVWRDSSFHVEFLADALIRRSVLTPRALVRWIFNASNSTPWAAAMLAEAHAPARLLSIAVDRAIDLLAAAHAAGDVDILQTQIDEAKELVLDITAAFAVALDPSRTPLVLGAVDADEEPDEEDRQDHLESLTQVGIAVLRDLLLRFYLAQTASLPATFRSSRPVALPAVIDTAEINTRILHADLNSELAQKLRAAVSFP